MKLISKSTNWPATLPIPYYFIFFAFYFLHSNLGEQNEYTLVQQMVGNRNMWWEAVAQLAKIFKFRFQKFCRDLWYCGSRRFAVIFDNWYFENCGCGEESWPILKPWKQLITNRKGLVVAAVWAVASPFRRWQRCCLVLKAGTDTAWLWTLAHHPLASTLASFVPCFASIPNKTRKENP